MGRSNKTAPTIRRVVAGDYDALCAIIDQVDRLHREALPHLFQAPPGPPREREYISGLLGDDNHGLFVAEVGRQLAGFVHVVVRDTPAIPILVPRRVAVIEDLTVSEDFRRKGLGRALMNRAEAWARDRGADEVELTVFEFNEPAQAFYRRLGYETSSRRMSRRLT